MSVYGYLFCRWIWLYLSQEVALVFLLQPVWQYVFLLCATSPFPKINSLFPPPPTPAAFLSQLHIPKSPFHGGLYLHPSWVLIPLCSLFALLFFLHLASLTGRWGIDRAVPQCQIWNRGSSPPCFHWPIIPFPTGLKGPSVTDNLPVREGETEEMREGVLSLSPFPSSLPVSFVIDFSCPVSFSSPFFELFSWSLFLFITLSVIPFLLLYSDNNGLNLDHWTEIKAFFSTFIYPGKVSWAQIRYSWLWP